MRRRFSLAIVLLPVLSLMLVLGLSLRSTADPAAELKVSAFAPAEDLIAQLAFFNERIEDALSSETDYSPAKQVRVERDGSTVAVIAQNLALHDSDHALKGSSAALLKASREMASGFED